MEAPENKEFTINVQASGLEDQAIKVNYAETTDGIPYYICKIDGKEVQLRKDEKWEQIWGDLKPEEIDAIGIEINKHIL